MTARSGGSYAADPDTGELTLLERTLSEAPVAKPPAAEPSPTPGSTRRPAKPPQPASDTETQE